MLLLASLAILVYRAVEGPGVASFVGASVGAGTFMVSASLGSSRSPLAILQAAWCSVRRLRVASLGHVLRLVAARAASERSVIGLGSALRLFLAVSSGLLLALPPHSLLGIVLPMFGFVVQTYLVDRQAAWWAMSPGSAQSSSSPGASRSHLAPYGELTGTRLATRLFWIAVFVALDATLLPASMALSYALVFAAGGLLLAPTCQDTLRAWRRNASGRVALAVALLCFAFLAFALPAQLTSVRKMQVATHVEGLPLEPEAKVDADDRSAVSRSFAPRQDFGVVVSSPSGALLVACRGAERSGTFELTGEQRSHFLWGARDFVLREPSERTVLGWVVRAGIDAELPFRAPTTQTWGAIWRGPNAPTSPACGVPQLGERFPADAVQLGITGSIRAGSR